MTMVDLDDELYTKAQEFKKQNAIDYPTMKNLVDKAVRKLIEEKKGDVDEKDKGLTRTQ